MNELRPAQKQRRRSFIYFYILLVLLILLVTASYTWFSISQTPGVSDMEMHVNAAPGMELALSYDAENEDWGQVINFPDLIPEETPLKPATWSEAKQSFLAASYGSDGRLSDQWETLEDASNANRKDGDGYYVVGSFYVRTGQNCEVALREAVAVNGGENGAGTYVIGTPVWDAQELLHDDGGSGAETAIRIGFRITPVDRSTGESRGDSSFYIYEPNCDTHISDTEGYVETPSVDGGATLSDHLILQTASSWSEAYPVQREVTIKELGEFTTPTALFTLRTGEIMRVDLYVWLEGQDVDCTNEIEEAQIFANIQFFADYSEQGGMVDIPA